ncbi:MAG: hypothetical protein MUE52_11840 [Tabrizicola sp.]|jgi:hypothetical protein|nr:hypothetical protein [Tabrizicola sp.]
MRSLALLSVLMPLPLHAEPPRISLVFGADSLTAQPEDIQSVRRIDDGARGSALVIRLAATMTRQMTALTLAHVGETGQLLICGELAVEPYLDRAITDATFILSDTDIARIDQLQALLTGPSCDLIPDS